MYTHILVQRLQRYKTSHETLYVLGSMLFFWALFDASFSYMVPLVITQSGYSKSIMGIILGSSSFFGALFDFGITRFFRSIHYRRIYLTMFIVCFLCPAMLWRGNPIWIFLTAMAAWGLYFDLFNFGNLDFVSKNTPHTEHSSSFGVIWVFRALGYTIAPLCIGAFAAEFIPVAPYIFMWFVISASFLLFLILLSRERKNKKKNTDARIPIEKRSTGEELRLWTHIAARLLPVLLLTFFIWSFDAFFWTVGPLMSQELHLTRELSGLFLALYTLPPFLFGFFVGRMNKKLGKKRSIQIFGLLASSIMVSFMFLHSPIIILCAVLIASICMGFCAPSLHGAFADYVSEAPHVEKEIEALQDFFTNLGYIIGPIIAGFLADTYGNTSSFSFLGLGGLMLISLSILTSPKHITVLQMK